MNIGILHLSDIHFGQNHVEIIKTSENAMTEYISESKKLIEDIKILQGNGLRINYIVVTGDLTETSSTEEYEMFEAFILDLIKFLKIAKKNVIMVPGNHDINRCLCQAARLRANALRQDFEKPYFEKFEIFKRFFDGFYNDTLWEENDLKYHFNESKLFVNYFFPEEKIIFCGLNSSIDESELAPHYGKIGVTQLSAAINEIKSIDTNNEYFKIALMHHNFLRASDFDDENLKDADDLLPILIDNSFKIVLHGHHHDDQETITGKGNKIVRVLATGSSGLDSEKIPGNSRKYQLIHIKDNTLRLFRRRFDSKRRHSTGIGCWVPDIDPAQATIFSEISLSSNGNLEIDETVIGSKSYDVYKMKGSSDALIYGEDILRIAYPKREIEMKGGVFDHKNKIYYEYLSVNIGLNHRMCFLFVGKNINIKATLTHFAQNHKLPKLGLTICTPRVKSKITGNAEFRAKNIHEFFLQIIEKNKSYSNYNVETTFIDDFVWSSCLDSSITANKEIINEDEFFIDQNIFSYSETKAGKVQMDEGLSLKYFKTILNQKFEEDYNNPVMVILGYGGVGKSTLCNSLVNIVNSYDRKKALYINSFDLIEKIETTDIEVKTISDLFKLYDSLTGFKFQALHEPNNLEINISCGNLIVIIDGLDEIESYLKGKFDIDNFLQSLINLHEQFNNCKIIITSRDYHEVKYNKKDGINILYLRGFDENLTKTYFEKRFKDLNLRKKGIEYSKNLGIKSQDRYMPLCLSLISQIIEREDLDKKFNQEQLFDTKILKPKENPIDNLLCHLIDRETAKQHLNISIDQLVELLFEISVIHEGHMSLEDFNEYVEIYFHSSINDQNNDGLSSFHINPLFQLNEKVFYLRYDILNHLFQVRYIQKSFKEEAFSNDLISLMSKNAFGVGIVFDELIQSTENNRQFINSSKKALQYFIDLFRENNKKGEANESVKKAISALLYYVFLVINPTSKSERAELLIELYGSKIQYIFIWGDFFPLDFRVLKIFDGAFVGFNNLFKSNFPSDEKVFHYCHFQDIEINGNPHIPKAVFDETCSIPKELKYLFEIDSKNRATQHQLVKDDIKAFMKSFVYTNSFASKTYNHINSNYMSKLDKKKLIDEAMKFGLIFIDNSKRRSTFYAVDSQHYNSILNLLNQNILDNTLEAFCTLILTKYYKKLFN